MYGKIFAQMYDGTLTTKGPWQALVTFQQLIVLADKHGEVDMTAEAISRRTTIPLDIIQIGLQELVLPDDDSRSPDENGRRIVPIDPARAWGWRVVNYDHYRKIRSEEDRREYHKMYARRRREKEKSTEKVNISQHVNTESTESTKAVSSKQEAKEEKAKKKRESMLSPQSGSRLPDNFPDSDAIAWAKQERPEVNAISEVDNFRDYWIAKPGKDGKKADWLATWRNWIRRAYANKTMAYPTNKQEALEARNRDAARRWLEQNGESEA